MTVKSAVKFSCFLARKKDLLSLAAASFSAKDFADGSV